MDEDICWRIAKFDVFCYAAANDMVFFSNALSSIAVVIGCLEMICTCGFWLSALSWFRTGLEACFII